MCYNVLMNWALRRQIFYVLILVLFLAGLGFLITYPSLNKAPSCVDNKQNGNETGIDCGGSCAIACTSQVDAVSILWARAFKVIPGRYNAVAYIENHNKTSAINKISYRFRFADANNIYIGKREGSTFIPPAGKFAIFEPGIDIGNSIPVYTTFEFTQIPKWLQVSPDKANKLQVAVSNIQLLNETTSPNLSATVKNNSLFAVKELNVIAILYDLNHNAVSASRTYIENLKAEENRDINFTWPEPLPGKVILKEIIPFYNFWSK